jgi:hypothetical protein
MAELDIHERRWRRLHQYLHEDCADDRTRLADRLNRSASQTSRLLNKGKNHSPIGEKLARKLEIQMGKPHGWFDSSENSEKNIGSAPVIHPVLRWPFKIEYGRFEALDPKQKDSISKVVTSMIEAFEGGKEASERATDKRRARRR